MTKDELLQLFANFTGSDPEIEHGDADDALIAYIADPEIKAAYEKIGKWYA